MVTGFSASRTRWGLVASAVAVVTVAAVAFVLAAGTGSGHSTRGPLGAGASVRADRSSSADASQAATKAPIPKVAITQPGVRKGVQSWKQPIRVKVSHGTLLAMTAVDDKGVTLVGAMTGAGWTSTGVVVPGRTYLLRASVRSLDGVKTPHRLHVRTSAPDSTVHVKVNVQVGKAVGVGWPLTVNFTSPVTNKVAVQNALQVQTSVPVTGAWHWFSDTEVHYRPESYWPAHTQILLHRDLDGIEVAPGVWGTEDNDLAFNVGDKHLSTVDVATHRMTVTVNDQLYNTYKVSTGRPSLPTLGGVHIVLEKWASIEMNSETLKPPIHTLLPNGKKNPLAYDEKELWATRISNAGAFVHFNPDTVKVQGLDNASHGCINTDLHDAEQFYNLSLLGDVVNVVNSPALPNVGDPGMADWNYTWTQWLAGSATGT